MIRASVGFLLFCMITGAHLAAGADLSVADLALPPGESGKLIVSGQIAGDETFGVTILLEIVPRDGSFGSVSFTPATGPGEVDVAQVGDPWPGVGSFTAFDTDPPPGGTGSPLLNGSIDDNGTFLPEPLTFAGPMAGFPIIASLDARGVWDVLLSTSAGDSLWEGVSTALVSGAITVTATQCSLDGECDDGVFCNGAELCVDGVCDAGVAPCDDGLACTADSCNETASICNHDPDDAVCDDGLFCSGQELCHSETGCTNSGDPCRAPATCDEPSGRCLCTPHVALAAGPRYIDVTPPPGDDPVAISVTGLDPDVSCVAQYVSATGALGNNPVYRTPLQWTTLIADPLDDPDDPVVHMRGESLVSGMTYAVRIDCDPIEPGGSLSDPVTVTVWAYGDVDDSGPLVDILDATRILDGFRAQFHTLPCTTDDDCRLFPPYRMCDQSVARCLWITRENVDIIGASGVCLPNRTIEIIDVVTALDAFRSLPDPCARPCSGLP